MRKIIVISMMSLDGVIQSPGGPKEDTSNGFKLGGWVAPQSDEMYDQVVQRELQLTDYLLGRKTYSLWAGYWPKHGDFWPGINEGTKYVVSRRLKKTDKIVTGWKNSVVLRNATDIKKLKKTNGADIQVWGSSEIVHLLLKHDLVDELRLKIHPLILGKGKNLFDKGATPANFELVENIVTTKGVIIASYKRAGKVKTAAIGDK
ncbi:MAG TPA: dihydrofolate reductase family protein [Cyclobacteriaceae bacterium]